MRSCWALSRQHWWSRSNDAWEEPSGTLSQTCGRILTVILPINDVPCCCTAVQDEPRACVSLGLPLHCACASLSRHAGALLPREAVGRSRGGGRKGQQTTSTPQQAQEKPAARRRRRKHGTRARTGARARSGMCHVWAALRFPKQALQAHQCERFCLPAGGRRGQF